jgi:TonB-linked SusC/RagA family outer membrane protein
MFRLSPGRALRALAAVVGFALSAAPLAAQTGRVTGRVTDEKSGAPLNGARVTVVGTSLVTGTNADGRYTLVNVPAGAQRIRVQIIGYGSRTVAQTIASGSATTVDFALATAAIALDAVVTTATGEQRKTELGNAVSTINAATLTEKGPPISNLGDLLVGKAAGVQILPGNLTGTSQRIRIRGVSSVSLASDPIVFVDGIRVTSDNNSSSIGVGGSNPSRLNDINPDDIESLEIVKGPSAATLYGTDAANGVILIKTKRGQAGAAKWSFYAEQGSIRDQNRWPAAYRAWRTGTTATTNSTAANTVQCLPAAAAGGTCSIDSTTSFNVFKDPRTSPFGVGNRMQYGLNVSGGTETVRYYLGTEYEDELGILKSPALSSESFLARRGVAPRYDQDRPNRYSRFNVRANLNAQLNSKIDVAVSNAFISSTQRLPQTDNNATGFLSNATSGMGNFDPVRLGYRQYLPSDSWANITSQEIGRYIGSLTTNFRPTSWLAGRATAGVDFTTRNDRALCLRDQCGLGLTLNQFNLGIGYSQNNRSEIWQTTGDVAGTATFRPTNTIELKTTAGAQFVGRIFERNGAYGENLPPGGTLASQGALPLVEQLQSESRTLGVYVEQQVSWRDKLFVTGGLRRDRVSSFGKDFGALTLPKLSLSYVISDEGFFPKSNLVSSLRLRASTGESAVQPGPTDALLTYGTATWNDGAADLPGVVFTSLGNSALTPERGRETEAGFEIGFLKSMVNLEFTYYEKLSTNGLLSRTLPPSVGGPATQLGNLASVSNRGFEYLLNLKLIDGAQFGADLIMNGSRNVNRLQSLGDVAPIIGTTTRQTPGFPVNGYWARPITGYNDANNDGILVASEVTVGPDFQYVGVQLPVHEMTFQGGFEFWRRRIRVSALVDRKTGHHILNGTDRIRCESRLNCRGVADRNAPLWEQARAVAVRLDPSRTQFGFMEAADFTRLREVAINAQLPQSWARAMKGRDVSVTLAARNLKLWTIYSGIDPESNYLSGTGFQSDFQTQPPPAYYTIRFNYGF